MTLQVFSRASDTEKGLVDVHWRVGGKTGLVKTRVVDDVSDQVVAAELAATHWLLTGKAVMGRDRTGHGLRLVFSRGAVKKLVRKDSTKRDLAIYARYLTTRFEKARIDVEKEPIEHGEDLVLDDLLVEGPPRILFFSPCIGWLEVTTHAIERYVERPNSGEISKAWASLTRRLSSPDFCQVDLPPEVLARKKIKHQDGQEVWKHPWDTMHYVVVPKADGTKMLVTTFPRG